MLFPSIRRGKHIAFQILQIVIAATLVAFDSEKRSAAADGAETRWEIKESEVGPAVGLEVTIAQSKGVSENATQYAYSAIKKLGKRPHGVDLYAATSSKRKSYEFSADETDTYRWLVNGKTVDLSVDAEILTDLFVDLPTFEKLANSGIVMENAGMCVFDQDGKDWVLLANCTTELRDRPVTVGGYFASFILVWVNGKFTGAIQTEPRSILSSAIFDSQNKQIALVTSRKGDASSAIEKWFTLASYSGNGYKDYSNRTGKKDRPRLGVETIFSEKFEKIDVRLSDGRICWAIASKEYEYRKKYSLRWPGGEALYETRNEIYDVVCLPDRGILALEGITRGLYDNSPVVVKSLSINGVPQKKFERVLGSDVSPNGKHYAALVTENGKTYSLIDNKATELPLDNFSETVDVAVDNELKWRAIGEINLENGTVLNRYLWTSNVVWGSEKSSYAFLALKRALLEGSVGGVLSTVLVVDGVEKPIDFGVRLIDGFAIISEIGSRITLNQSKKVLLSWNPPTSDESEQGEQEGTYVRKNGTPVGGKKYVLHPGVEPMVSSDGKDVFFFARSAGEWKLFANGEELAGFDEIGNGNTPVALNSADQLVFFAERGGFVSLVQVRASSSSTQK